MNRIVYRARRQVVTAALALGIILVGPSQAVERAGPFLEERTVRVVVHYRGMDYVSTGFAWRRQDQFVTALHGMRPCQNCIRVEFQGRAGVNARVVSVLPNADLALLQTDQPIGGVTPFDAVHVERPPDSHRLAVLGYASGNTNAVAKYPTKEYTRNETIRGLMGRPTEASRALERGRIPNFDLPIYAVGHGLFPGFSGGAVVDSQHRLVGVVDGGLDKGMTGFNWVIPAEHILALEKSGQSTLPPGLEQVGLLFSSGVPGEPVSQPANEGELAWYPLKTRSVAQLLESTPDPDGLLQLGEYFDVITEHVEPEDVSLQLFQDLELGMIIAVPASMELAYDEAEDYLYVNDPSGAIGEAFLHFAYNEMEAFDENDNPVHPDHEDFLAYLATNYLLVCEEWVQEEYSENATCEMDDSILSYLEFPDGSKMLRFGTIAYEQVNEEDARYYAYDYLSVAVRDGQTVSANVFMELSEDGGLLECMIDENYCTDFERGRAQFELLVAAHLTNFSDLQDPVQRNLN